MTLIVSHVDVFARPVPTQQAHRVNALLENVDANPSRFTEMRTGDTVKSKTSVQTHRTLLSKPLRSVSVKNGHSTRTSSRHQAQICLGSRVRSQSRKGQNVPLRPFAVFNELLSPQRDRDSGRPFSQFSALKTLAGFFQKNSDLIPRPLALDTQSSYLTVQIVQSLSVRQGLGTENLEWFSVWRIVATRRKNV